ncbi:hypothetical protein MLD52_19530 [Puniceicoccaceae bacterium K14]|nr:hypothetical protein [Puniceicoccaceae bacterium K14]
MTAKIFTIGDSISQGFMSGAAANTEFCYSTLISDAIKQKNYRYNKWDQRYKTKVDLERILRTLEKRYGSNIRGLEWVGVAPTINSVLDQAEDYFERGDGRLGEPVLSPHTNEGFHNVAVEGMDVADVFQVTPKLCRTKIRTAKKRKDEFLGIANASFYRNAYRTLNPQGLKGEKKYGDYTAVDWLRHVSEEEGVENLLLWIGANNALGTVLSLNIKQTPNDPDRVLKADRDERSEWNLWHPNDFRAEYTILLDKIVSAMKNNKCGEWRAFIGNIPLVTIAPLAKGVGEHRIIKDPAGTGRDCLYYQYYTYFPLSKESALKTGKYLKFKDALFIDQTIIEFNKIIKDLVSSVNQSLGKDRLHVVDTSKALSEMAWKRNIGQPTYKFPKELAFLHPQIDTKYYHSTRDGKLEKGGVFSLDGIHPSAIGQGLIAHEFLKEMKNVHSSAYQNANLDWKGIVESDTLRQDPITLMSELYEHDGLIKFLAKIGNILNMRD